MPRIRRTMLKHKAALWLLHQALPDAPDIAAILRMVFATMTAAVAAGVTLTGVAGLVLFGLHHLMLDQGATPTTALLTIAALGVLLAYAVYRTIQAMIDRWTTRRAFLAAENSLLDQARDLFGVLASDFVSGLKNARDATREERSHTKDSATVDETPDPIVTPLHTKKNA